MGDGVRGLSRQMSHTLSRQRFLSSSLTTCTARCLVSKPWVPWTQRHSFARVESGSSDGPTLQSWMKAFRDPSDSPAHYTRALRIEKEIVRTDGGTVCVQVTEG